MIKHIVLFKVNDKSKIDTAKNMILDLKNNIPEIKEIEVFTDIAYDKNASDFGLIATFEGEKELDIYANHPIHLKVIEFIKTIATQRSAIDYKV